MTLPITIPTPAQVAKLAPLNETLFLALRQGLVDLEACINFLTDGVQINADLVTQLSIAANAVGQSELKSAFNQQAAAINLGGPVNFFFPVINTTFYPQWQINPATPIAAYQIDQGQALATGAGVGPFMTWGISQSAIQATTVTVTFWYVPASPPHRLGAIPDWGPFVFRKVDAAGKVLGVSIAEDPPWYLACKGRLPKDHPAAVAACPHPWPTVVDDQGAPVAGLLPGERVQLVDMRAYNEDVAWSESQDMLTKMQDNRAAYLADGVTGADLDAWEEMYAAKVAAEGYEVRKAWELAKTEADSHGRPLAEFLIPNNEAGDTYEAPPATVSNFVGDLQAAVTGEVEALEASDVSKLPVATPFTDVVDVVRPK